jgi:hypothetical protein
MKNLIILNRITDKGDCNLVKKLLIQLTGAGMFLSFLYIIEII